MWTYPLILMSYNCVDVKTNDIVWNFEFEEDV